MKTSVSRAYRPLLNPAFYDDVISGLSAEQKTLPCKYLYDAAGSELFEQICDLKEYYVTRTEMGILRNHIGEMAQAIGTQAKIIEFGAGAGTKTELLLGSLTQPSAYNAVLYLIARTV